MNINIKIHFNFFKARKEKNKNYEPSDPPYYESKFLIYMIKTWCVGGRQYSNTNIITQYEKIKPKTKNLFKIVKGSCSFCGRSKSQIFTR